MEINIGRLTVSLIRTALFVALLGGVSACSPQKQATTDTLSPTIDIQPTPISEPIPTILPSLTVEPLALADFSAQLEGMGTNGTMACVTYNGDPADLEQVVLTANISQGSTKIESDIVSQNLDGKTCFEVVDAKYVSVNPEDGTLVIPESPVMLEINAASTEGKPITNSTQTLNLGQYMQFPFLGWIYDTQKVCRVNDHNHQDQSYMAWDFIPYPTSKNPTIINTPVLSPAEGYLFVAEGAILQAGGHNYSVMVYIPKTGYLIDLTHNADFFIKPDSLYVLQSSRNGVSVITGERVAMIGAKDETSGMPHTHMQIIIPTSKIDLTDIENTSNLLWNEVSLIRALGVDPMKTDLFLDGSMNNYLSNLPNSANECGNFQWGTLIEPVSQLAFTIDGMVDDWAGYTPVLTDTSGDSQTASIMDFTELYTAKDDNYLYLMLKAGNNNGSKLWAVQLFANTDGSNKCEGANKVITLDAGTPDAILISDIKSCSDIGNPAAYTGGKFAWQDVIEAKIPLIYLSNPSEVDITKLMGMLQTDSGWTQPDTVP